MKLEERKMYKMSFDSIDLHPESVEYLKVLDTYTEVDESPDYFHKPVIHMYAKEDTYDESGSLNGYRDSLFFECKVYDPVNKIVYTSKGLHDSLDCYELKPDYVRIFKDGSTLVSFSKDVKVAFLQSVTTYEVCEK